MGVRSPVCQTVRELFDEGMAPSDIDRVLKLHQGTAKQCIVYDWAADMTADPSPLQDDRSCILAYDLRCDGRTDEEIGEQLGVRRKTAGRMAERGRRLRADERSWSLRFVSNLKWAEIASLLCVSENAARKMSRRHGERIELNDRREL